MQGVAEEPSEEGSIRGEQQQNHRGGGRYHERRDQGKENQNKAFFFDKMSSSCQVDETKQHKDTSPTDKRVSFQGKPKQHSGHKNQAPHIFKARR